MPTRWTESEDAILIAEMDSNRKAIRGKDIMQTNKITRQFADRLHLDNPVLQVHRTSEAAFQHIAYLDDLLAGAGSDQDYAKKDCKYFGKRPRTDGNKDWNLTKRRGYKARIGGLSSN